MKLFNDSKKDWAYFAYRIVEPIIDPIKFVKGLGGYIWFLKDALQYKKMDTKAKIFTRSIFPQIHDKTSLTPFDAHYFHQQLWAFEKVLYTKPKHHYDVASTYELSGYISKIVPTTFIDIRPIDTKLKNLSIKNGDILNLPYKDNELKSVTCLHVIEHIGLGRYGDPIDPDGLVKACKEMQRVITKGGRLYLTTPIGKKRLCFNAHRVTPPSEILNIFSEMTLKSFAVVDDEGQFKENVDSRKYENLNYGCGMFELVKK